MARVMAQEWQDCSQKLRQQGWLPLRTPPAETARLEVSQESDRQIKRPWGVRARVVHCSGS